MSHALPVTLLATLTTALRRALPVLPVVAVIALLGLPIAPSAEGGANIADAMSGLVVLCCAIHLVRARRRPCP